MFHVIMAMYSVELSQERTSANINNVVSQNFEESDGWQN
jgi:hypothetical protein